MTEGERLRFNAEALRKLAGQYMILAHDADERDAGAGNAERRADFNKHVGVCVRGMIRHLVEEWL